MADKTKNFFSEKNIVIGACIFIVLLVYLYYFSINSLIRWFIYVLIPIIKEIVLIILGIQLIRLTNAYLKKAKK